MTETTSDGIWSDWGGHGPLLHFTHANGFPCGTYRVFLNCLCERFHVVSSEARPLWPGSDPMSMHSWHDLAGDLGSVLSEHGLGQVIGVGHSVGGATTLLAAAADPARFSAIVLIDPLLLTGYRRLFWATMRRLGLAHRLHLVRSARRRRSRWPDRETLRRVYRSKAVFQGWADGVLDDYLDAGFVTAPGGGLELRYPRHWEARIFELSPSNLWPAIRRLEIPTLFIRGGDSDTLGPAAATRLRRVKAKVEVATVSGAGHLVPMEKPIETARLTAEFAARHAFVPSRHQPIQP